MAGKKPLVIGADGRIEEIQPGDYVNAPVSGANFIQKSNDNASPITEGQFVYLSSANGVDLARANAAATSIVAGVVADASIAAAASGNIQVSGIFALADWTPILGVAALTPGALYYLSAAAAGDIVAAPGPSALGEYLIPIGVACSTTEMQLGFSALQGVRRAGP